MTGGSTDTLASPTAVAAALVANEVERRRAGCERLLLAAQWADVHSVPPGEQGQQVGADGTPEVALFAVEELSCLIGQHPNAARVLQADALNLRHRHPRLWARVQAFDVMDWIAALTARKAAAAGLSLEEAQWLDEQTAEHVTALPTGRYLALVEAKIIEADPAAAEARREEEMRARFVRKNGRTEHGLKSLYARATFGEIDHVYATVDRIATILLLQGDTDDANVRRSKALGLLGTPQRVLELFAWAESNADAVDAAAEVVTDADDLDRLDHPLPAPPPSRAPRPSSVIHVQVSLEAITAGTGVARIEDVGPVALAAIRELLGHTHVTIKPVVDLTVNATVDRYEIPQWLKEIVRERFPFEVFPYGTTPARKSDTDHSVAYRLISEGGSPGQTNADNLAPLGRRAHRAKTFGPGWRHIRVGPRSFLWRTPTGYWYRVDPDGTESLGQAPSLLEEHFKALLYAA